MLQRERRYKTNIPGDVVTQTDAKKFHAATVKEIKDEVEIISQVKDQVDPRGIIWRWRKLKGPC